MKNYIMKTLFRVKMFGTLTLAYIFLIIGGLIILSLLLTLSFVSIFVSPFLSEDKFQKNLDLHLDFFENHIKN